MALVCHCEGIGHRKIAKSIAHGASSVLDVQLQCGAGSRCGGCIPVIEEMLGERAPETAMGVMLRAG